MHNKEAGKDIVPPYKCGCVIHCDAINYKYWPEGRRRLVEVGKMVQVQVVRLPHGLEMPLPTYATDGAAGMDLLAAVERPTFVFPGDAVLVPTGLKIALPKGYELQIRSKSGLALNKGVIVLNSPGTIDEDFRGEIMVILMNHGVAEFTINRGVKIAQAVIAPVTRFAWNEVAELDTTNRGTGGFGSTGQ